MLSLVPRLLTRRRLHPQLERLQISAARSQAEATAADVEQQDRETDGRTFVRYIDHPPHTMRAVQNKLRIGQFTREKSTAYMKRSCHSQIAG